MVPALKVGASMLMLLLVLDLYYHDRTNTLFVAPKFSI